MQDLCPLCLKNGLKKRIKLYQINLKEAVRMCEEGKCVWPFGYEEIVLYPKGATSASEDSSIISSIDDKEKYEKGSNLNIKIDTSDLQSINNNVGNMKIGNECINSLHKYSKEKDGIFKSNVNSTREAPKITSIKKTNIDISNVKKVLSSKYTNVGGANLEPIKSNKTIAKSNLSVTTAEINGLPPITLSFEIPVSNVTPETVTSAIQPLKSENDSTKLNNLKPKKRSFTSGKHYEKLTVSDFLRKIKSTNTCSNSKDLLSTKTNIKSEPEIKKEPCDFPNDSNLSTAHEQTVPNTSTTSVSDQLNNSAAYLPSRENIVSDVAVENSITNIDNVLEDFILNGSSVSEDANDEWLEGFLLSDC